MEAFSPVKRIHLHSGFIFSWFFYKVVVSLNNLSPWKKTLVINDKFWKTNKNLRKLLITPVNNEDSPCKWASIPTFVISVLISDDSIAI